jgi:cytochrome d ubiquinol oxidase subunit I
LSTLVLFVLCYGVVFTAGIYYINRLIAKGPRIVKEETGHFSGGPIAAAGSGDK